MKTARKIDKGAKHFQSVNFVFVNYTIWKKWQSNVMFFFYFKANIIYQFWDLCVIGLYLQVILYLDIV